MKKFMIWMLMLGLIFLAACNNEAPEATTEEVFVILDGSEAAVILPEEAVIGVTLPDAESAGMKGILTALKGKMEEAGISKENITIAEWTEEDTGVQQLIEKGIHLLLAGDSEGRSVDIKALCTEAGVPVIFFYEQTSEAELPAYADEVMKVVKKHLNGEISDSCNDMK